MAWLDLPPSGVYHIGFRYAGRRWKRSLDTTNSQIAERARVRVEENLRLVQQGRLDVPSSVDVAEFLLFDGKLSFVAHPATDHSLADTIQERQNELNNQRAEELDRTDIAGTNNCLPVHNGHASNGDGHPRGMIPMPLDEVFKAYLKQLPAGALADETLRVAQIHFDHLTEVIGPDTPMLAIDHERLQAYVNKRSQSQGRRGRLLSTVTIKKELSTLRSVWIWAKGKYTDGDFPATKQKLSYPATSDKSEFQTMAEVERKIALGHLSPEEEEDLWDCVFLTLPEIDELLQHVRRQALHPFLYPMFVFAAHSGARRSEMRRSDIQDIDFNGKRIVLRERKRVHGKHTLRSVPMSPQLEPVLLNWLARHPGGRFTFCLGPSVPKSSKTRAPSTPLTCEEAGHHFQQVLRGTKWAKLRGWHVFRHSFCSNCAAKGVPQRMINQWVGHQTEEMVKRYRHMVPSQERAAIKHVFA